MAVLVYIISAVNERPYFPTSFLAFLVFVFLMLVIASGGETQLKSSFNVQFPES